jgi:hypothetical protein
MSEIRRLADAKTQSLDLILLPDHLAVCRLPAGAELPAWAVSGGLLSVSWTHDETSIVCSQAAVPLEVQADVGWRALKVAGPLDFSLTGILLSIAQPLAEAGIGIFAVSTYDTDYVLVKETSLGAAETALTKFDHHVIHPQ